MTSIRVTLLATIAAIGMTLPAAASPATSDTGPVQPTPFQYAQMRADSPVDYGYKTAKCKKSDKKCQAKSKKKKKSDTSDTKG